MNIVDKLKLAQRTIAMLSSMVDAGECHTTRSREMKQHGLEALADIGIANEATTSDERERLIDDILTELDGKMLLTRLLTDYEKSQLLESIT